MNSFVKIDSHDIHLVRCNKNLFRIAINSAALLPSMSLGAVVETPNLRTLQSQHRCVVINIVCLFYLYPSNTMQKLYFYNYICHNIR